MSNPHRKVSSVQYKRETFLNLCMLNKVHPMSRELSVLVFHDNALEKPTQNSFNHISYYLVAVIDKQAALKFSWPLLDSKAQKVYRTDLYNFINTKSGEGLTPVMSSYFVNPGYFKVTVLIFQMSVLAINTVIRNVGNETQKKMGKKLYDRFKRGTDGDDLVHLVETQRQCKVSKHLIHRRASEETAAKLRNKIKEIETKVKNAQKYIDCLVDEYIVQHNLDKITKDKILSIKNVHQPSPFFDDCLNFIDEETMMLENNWNAKVRQFLNLSKKASTLSEEIVTRYTGQADKNSYMVSYNPKTDKICTENLQKQVNVEQRYILRNLEINGKLNFPNLIRSFVFSISFLMKNIRLDDDICTFNKYLQGGYNNLHEIVLRMHIVMERISKAESQLEHKSSSVNLLPPGVYKYPGNLSGPSLTNLVTSNDYKAFFDAFSPLVLSRNKSNINYRPSLLKPLMPLRDDFTRSFMSKNINKNHDISNNTISFISQGKQNETINDCSMGFTQQRVQRLLSTKKSKSSTNRQEEFKRSTLNYDSGVSVESNGLIRSISSPNLFENRRKNSIPRLNGKKLSTMQEDCPFELSGISALNNSSNFSTPGVANAESSRISVQSPKLKFNIIPPEDDLIKFTSSPLELHFSSKDDLDKYTPRQSLGAVLGVDHTILDEFDLSD